MLKELTKLYRHSLAACAYNVLPGPGKRLHGSVPPSRGQERRPAQLAALTAPLDQIDWRDMTARHFIA